MSEARLPPRPPAAQYTPEAVTACEKALRTLLGRIGPWGGRMVLVGGLVPRYLVSAASETVGPHIGTTDLDVVLGVALATDEEEVYRTLQRNLVEAQFHPGRDEDTGQELSYRWQRDDVDGVRVVLVDSREPSWPRRTTSWFLFRARFWTRAERGMTFASELPACCRSSCSRPSRLPNARRSIRLISCA